MKNLTKLIFIIALLLNSNNKLHAQQPKDFDENYAKALADFQSSDYNSCINILTNALASSKNQYYYTLRGDAFYALEAYQNALADYGQALQIDENIAVLKIAKTYARLEKFPEAVENLKKYLSQRNKKSLSEIKLDPAFSKLSETRLWGKLMSEKYYKKSEIATQEIKYLMNANKLAEALSLANVRIKKNKRYAEGYILRSEIFKSNKQYKQALKDCSKAIEIRKKQADYYLKRADLYIALRKFDKAVADFETYENLLPNQIKVKSQKAYALYLAERFDEANLELSAYLKYFKATAEDNYLQGKIGLAQNKNLTALKHLNYCIEQDSSKPKYFKARAEAYKRASMYQRSLNDLGMALDLKPDGETYYLRALLRLETGNIQGACYDKKLAKHYRFYKAEDIIIDCSKK